jgi:hypothetical protein
MTCLATGTGVADSRAAAKEEAARQTLNAGVNFGEGIVWVSLLCLAQTRSLCPHSVHEHTTPAQRE